MAPEPRDREMLWSEGGSFRMGSESFYPEEAPIRTISRSRGPGVIDRSFIIAGARSSRRSAVAQRVRSGCRGGGGAAARDRICAPTVRSAASRTSFASRSLKPPANDSSA